MDSKWTDAGKVLILKTDIKNFALGYPGAAAPLTPEEGQRWYDISNDISGFYNGSDWYSKIKALGIEFAANKSLLAGAAARKAGFVRYKDADEIYIDGNLWTANLKTCFCDTELTYQFGSGGSNAGSADLGANEWHYLYLDNSSITSGTELTAANFINTKAPPRGDSTASGAATSTSANKLVDSNADFGNETIPTRVGMKIFNTTDNTIALITAIDSTTQLSIDADIMANGEDYTISQGNYSYSKRGYYNGNDRCIFAGLTDGSNNLLAFDWLDDGLYSFRAPITELSGGTSTSYAEIDCTSSIPDFGKMVGAFSTFVDATAANVATYVYLRDNDNQVGDWSPLGVYGETAAAGPAAWNLSLCPTDLKQIIEYKIHAANLQVNILVTGFKLIV